MFQDSCLLTLSPDFWNIVFFVFFGFFGFLDVFWIFAFLLLQESWNIVFFFLIFLFFFGFLEVFWIFAFARVLEYCFFFWFSRGFLFFWHSQTTGANANKTCKEVGFFFGGYHIYFRPWLSRPNFGRNKTDLQQFFDSVQISFHFDKCSFFTVFPWFQCYALFCCKYLYGIAPF